MNEQTDTSALSSTASVGRAREAHMTESVLIWLTELSVMKCGIA